MFPIQVTSDYRLLFGLGNSHNELSLLQSCSRQKVLEDSRNTFRTAESFFVIHPLRSPNAAVSLSFLGKDA